MLAAAVAVTVIGLEERRVDFKTHAATQTAAMDRLFHVRILNRMHVVASCLTADDADPPASRFPPTQCFVVTRRRDRYHR